MCQQLGPELTITHFCVVNVFFRGTVESSDGLGRITANDMFEVAVVLGEGFLDDRTKEGLVCSNLGIHCIPGASIPRWRKWEPVVDNDCVGDAEGVEIKSVDAGVAHFVVFIQEDALHTAWYFGKG